MENREKYIVNRNTMHFDIEDLYDFYKDKCTRNCIGFNEFEVKLPMYLNMGGNFNKYISDRDNHYNTLKLTKSDGSSIFL